jgi:hypothetical protein
MPFPTTLTPRFLINTSAYGDNYPTVAAGPDGRFELVWNNGNAAGDIYSYVYAGAAIGPEGVGSVFGLDVATTGFEVSPDSAFLTNGTHVVAWIDSTSFTGDYDIKMRLDTKNADGTYTRGARTLVNVGATTGDQFAPEVVALNGFGAGFVVSWWDQSTSTVKLQRYDANGVAQGGLLSQAVIAENYDVVALNNGGFALAYRRLNGGFDQIAVSTWDVNGAPGITAQGVAFQPTTANHGWPAIAQAPDGTIIVTWADFDGLGIGYRLFNAAFTPLTGDLLIPTNILGGGSGVGPKVEATLDGGFLVVFVVNQFASSDYNGNVYAQKISAGGGQDGASVLLSATTNASGEPEIARTADGRMIVTWTEGLGNGSDVYATILDPRTAGLNNLTGTSGRDNYVGSAFDDFIYGLAGDDTIAGMNGDDYLYGGDGNDLIEGGFSSDRLYGGRGNDRLFAMTEAAPGVSALPDSLFGDEGNDILTGSGGADFMSGGGGYDRAVLTYTRAAATITQNGSGNFIFFGDTRDWLSGVELAQFSDGTLVSLRERTNRSDLAGDGRSDILLQNSADGSVFVWDVNGTSVTGAGYVGWTPGAVWQAKGTGDFNGDGKSDVLLRNADTGQNFLWLADGLNPVSAASGYAGWAPGAVWKTRATGDFNGDGRSDILVQNADTGQCFTFMMNGTTTINYGQIGTAVGANWVARATGDFNGDGKSDILFQNENDGACYIWNVDGITVIANGQAGWTPGVDWKVRGTGDFNGDGRSDILLQNAVTGQCFTFIISGFNGTTAVNSGLIGTAVGANWVAKGTGDYNGDGKSDILFQDTGSGAAYVWNLDGTTVIQNGAVGWSPGAQWEALA